MKVLITGAAGFIGSNLAERLLDEGHLVVGVDNFITGSDINVERLLKNKNFCFVEANVSNLSPKQYNQLENYKFSEVYHLACPTGVPNLGPLAEEMLEACSAGTKNILELSRKCKSNLLFTSSSEVYGDPEIFPQSEDYTGNVDQVGERSPYEEGKRFAESIISMYVRKYGLDGKVVRVFNTYGPNMSRSDQRVIPNFIRQIEQGKPLTIHGDGDQKRTFCYVDDLINGLRLVMEGGRKGAIYNIGSNDHTTILDLAKIMIKISGGNSQIIFKPRPTHDHQSRLPDLTRINLLGWYPKISLEEGIALTLKQPQFAKL